MTNKKEDISKNVLLGVYDNASDYKEIPMGTFFNGAQKAFCKIKMPLEYTIGTTYSDGEDNNFTVKEMHGVMIEKVEVDNLANISNWAILGSVEGTKLTLSVLPTMQSPIENNKEYAKEYWEILDEAYYAMYYVDHSEYATSDLCFVYLLNDDMKLYITYEGPLADELGIDQLARNIYNLIEIIE